MIPLHTESLKIYDPDAVGKDGYPPEWHKVSNEIPGVKHLVREAAGHRCVRCGHPYRTGEHGRGEWSPCDAVCSHGGPGRHKPTDVDYRAAVPKGMPPIIDPDGWVYFDDGMFDWFVERGIEVEAKWRILTVHHLDGNKWNCSWWNLAPLCQRCHLQIQGKVKMAQVYPFEHSEWFKPYAAGFYAWVYRGEQLTREETMERLDDLLGLELSGS